MRSGSTLFTDVRSSSTVFTDVRSGSTLSALLLAHEVTLTATKSLGHSLIRVALRAPEVFQGLSEVEKNQRTRL